MMQPCFPCCGGLWLKPDEVCSFCSRVGRADLQSSIKPDREVIVKMPHLPFAAASQMKDRLGFTYKTSMLTKAFDLYGIDQATKIHVFEGNRLPMVRDDRRILDVLGRYPDENIIWWDSDFVVLGGLRKDRSNYDDAKRIVREYREGLR